MASPAAPSSVSSAMASAFSNHNRSGRAGVLTWIDPMPMPKRRSLVSRNPHSMPQRLPYRLFKALAVASVSLVARHQAPFIFLSRTDHGSNLVSIGRHHGAAQNGCTPAWRNPARGGARLAVRRRHGDIAAEADDVVELQFLGQYPVELLVAEAAIGGPRA